MADRCLQMLRGELDAARLAAWWQAYLTVLPVLVEGNPRGCPTKLATDRADEALAAYEAKAQELDGVE